MWDQKWRRLTLEFGASSGNGEGVSAVGSIEHRQCDELAAE